MMLFFLSQNFSLRAAAVACLMFGSFGVVEANAQCVTNAPNPGCVHFELRTSSSFDQYTTNMSSSTAQWLNSHFWEMQVSAPYFNTYLSQYPRAIAYFDLYGIHTDDPLVAEHPEWILKDQNGNLLYINFDCNGTTCSQYAFDFANPAFQQYQISAISSILAAGYVGIWLDNVDLQVETSNAAGTTVWPIDSTTGQVMTVSGWEEHVSSFATAIRLAFPSTQITHNSIWYAGTRPAGSDPYVQQEILAADYINLERGVGDTNLVAGSSEWGLNAMLSFVDIVHSLGRKVVVQEYDFDADYGLAGYYLISTGLDALGDDAETPDNWWSGYDTNLGTPLDARYSWNGVLRRDFSGGMALLNPFQGATVSLSLPGTFTTTSGSQISSVTLSGGEAAVLVGAGTTSTSAQTITQVPLSTSAPTITPVPLSSYYNREGIVTDGTVFSANSGLDDDGNAYSSKLLGTTLTFDGAAFHLGSPNTLNAVSNTTVTLPSGQFSTLQLLGAGVMGNQKSQTFTVTYTDGTTSTFTQGLSDWFTPQNYAGETSLLSMAYRNKYNRAEDARAFHVYAYSFSLNSSKTVHSIALPANSKVVILAMTLH